MYKAAKEKHPELVNIGKKWSVQEEDLLLACIKEGKSHANISVEFKRTEGGISSKLRDLAVRYFNDEEPIQIIMKLTGLSEEIINEALIHKKSKNEKEKEKKKKPTQDIRVMMEEMSINKIIKDMKQETHEEKENIKYEPQEPIIPLEIVYTLNEEQQAVLDQVFEEKNVFVTGPGGTGKTLIIRELRRQLEAKGKTVAVTSLTGMAALIIGKARTIHSWSGIGIGTRSVDDYFQFIRKCQPKIREAWRAADVLIIDEISMMSDEIFEKLDQLGQLLRWNEKPFGGVQIICLGDFFQLPPINAKFVFESAVWNKTLDSVVFLDQIYRQKDPVFQTMLNEIRLGVVSDETDRLLKSRLGLDFSGQEIQPTKVFTRRAMVDSVNSSALANVSGESISYKAITKTSVKITDSLKDALARMDENSPYVNELVLKIGTQVMLITNLNVEQGLVNGKTGIVKGFGPSYVMVSFKGELVKIERHEWKLETNEKVGKIQIPLVLAYAITIHKSQGSTLDSAYIDIGSNVFEYGQAYVALSRVKSLDSLYLHSYSRSAIKAHPKVVAYYKSLE